MTLDDVDKILDFAIRQEEKAASFYTELAAKMDAPHVTRIFLDFAKEEKGHKAKLLQVKSGKQMHAAEKQIADLKIGDYLEDVELSADLRYQDALILAMKAEKAAFKLYSDLAAATDNPELKDTLLALAQEEAKHKLRFEIEYDDSVLTHN